MVVEVDSDGQVAKWIKTPISSKTEKIWKDDVLRYFDRWCHVAGSKSALREPGTTSGLL